MISLEFGLLHGKVRVSVTIQFQICVYVAKMNFLMYLLLMADTLAREVKSVSVENPEGGKVKADPEKWSVGCCLLVSMKAHLFLRTKAQSNRARINQTDVTIRTYEVTLASMIFFNRIV